MAERIAQFPTPTRSRRYPWEEWTDGTVWKLRAGEDFDAEVDQFRNRLYTQAARRGMSVTTQKGVDDDGTEVLFMQFIAPPAI